MNTEILPAVSPLSLSRALEILRRGGLVAFPTDTVYGVGALVFNGEAVESIYTAKDRPEEKAIPILLGSEDDLPKV
ncbi:MAG: Sua5/YciO/YrdC/YwlC family protein, partial [Chloroflexi bacterium]|nr:Sua5/YciO/YrdC/YwlC family protein [Chloroflexota bacterium]